MNKRVLVAILYLGLASHVDAQQPYDLPTDTDLRAAYCLSVSQTMLADLERLQNQISANGGAGAEADATTRNAIAGLSDRVSRLRAYVLPKAAANDNGAIGLAAAAQRGRQDLATLQSGSQIAACTRSCAAKHIGHTPEENQAMTQCVQGCAPDISRKLRACTDLSWLPF
jgi:hypothetical protein